jgi:hypothetical protein
MTHRRKHGALPRLPIPPRRAIGKLGLALLIAAGFALSFTPAASAHVVVGARVFPVTLTFDDPGVGDEATLPQLVWQSDSGPQDLYQLQWEYDKTITSNTALIYNQGYDLLQAAGAKTHNGFENAVVTAKWQALSVPDREFVVSLGVIREFAGTSATVNIGGDTYGTTSPTLYFGKGLGDLPIGAFRPLAVTGELSYNIPDRRQNWAATNNGNPLSLSGSLSFQYSIAYLQSQVKDYGLTGILGGMIPLVELDWNSPLAAPATGNPATLIVAPGVIWLGQTYQVGLEALIPANPASGHRVGVIAQVHFFFDDLFPNSLGKPLVDWFN